MEGIKIMDLEGSNILKNNLDDMEIKKIYKAVFPTSLLLDKLMNIGLKVNKEITEDIVAVSFKYGYTPKVSKKLKKQIEDNKELISKYIVDKKDKLEQRKLQKNNFNKKPFTEQINELKDRIKDLKEKNKDLYKQIKNNEYNADKVREYLYKNGFYLDFYKKNKKTKEYELNKQINYVFWFRSPSKSRTGDTLFINKKLLPIIDWQQMGLKLPDKNAKLVEMQAYLGLTSSHIEDRIKINPDNILVVDDLESYTKVICTRINYHVPEPEKNPNDDIDKCYTTTGISKVKNILWDGMGLLSDKLFKGSIGMMLLRQHFFKCCGFRTYIQKFYIDYCKKHNKDYNTYKVKDRYGNYIYVKNIKLICTENSLKWEKFRDIGATFNYWKQKVKEDNCIFGVCKTDHPSKYGKYQRMSYQQINSLPINPQAAIELCKDSVAYVNKLKNNEKAYLEFLNRTKADVNANEMVIDLYNKNSAFANSEFYRTYKTKKVSEYKQTLKEGKLLVRGDNLTVCGNPYVLLLHTVGQVPYKSGVLEDGYIDITLPPQNLGYSVYTKQFKDGEKMGMFRNPHNAPNNILYATNIRHPLMERYFNFSKNIIGVNCIKTDTQDRANGMDFDSDFVLATNNPVVVEASKKAMDYPTIVNDISKDKRKYDNTIDNMVKVDVALAKGKYTIGVSSNLAQKALSWYWKTGDNKLVDIVCILSVLAQIAIDNSKRKYDIDLEKEINRIADLSFVKVKKGNLIAIPYFFQFVKDVKEKQINKTDYERKKYGKFLYDEAKIEERYKKNKKINNIKRHCIKEKVCPMDWIQEGIDKIKPKYRNDPAEDNINFIIKTDGKADSRQIKRVTQNVKKLDDLYKKHYNMGNEEDETWQVESMLKTNEILSNITKLSLKPKTIEMLVIDAFSKNSQYKRKLLNCLYKACCKKSDKGLFLDVFKNAEWKTKNVPKSN